MFMVKKTLAALLGLVLLLSSAVALAAAYPEQVVIGQGPRLDGVTGEKAQLNVVLLPEGSESKLVFASSKEKVAAVSKAGVMSFKKAGQTVVEVRAKQGGARARIEVFVTDPPKPQQLWFDMEQTVTLQVGQQLQLAARPVPEDAVSSLHWSSSNRVIAPVEDGLVSALAPGSALIRAQAVRGKAVACVRVVVMPDEQHPSLPLGGRRIGIDPGHQAHGNYGKEPVSPGSKKRKYKVSSGTGGVSTKVREHVQNLRIALQLRDALEALGAEVFMTRTSANVNISNVQRAKMMNAQDCELVLRLHCNAGSRTASGIGLYHSPIGPAKAGSKAAAQVLGATLKQSTSSRTWVSKTSAFSGCNWSTVPCVLIEMGFMSNPREDRLLNTPEYQQKLVQGMVDGALALLGS